MARYGQDHKEATRQRIIETAGRRFKQDGIDGSGIATLMADAGLTNGAFYAHFSSKQDLVATVIGDQLRSQADGYTTLSPGRAGLEEFIRQYLSPEHRDDRASGCPSAALLDEIGRCATDTKASFTAGAVVVIDLIASRLDPRSPESQRATAVALFTMLVGTLQLSRALDDQGLSDEILELGIRNALDLLPRD